MGDIKEDIKENIKVLPLEKDAATILNTILVNSIKMYTARGLLDEDKLEDNIKKLIASSSVDGTVYKIKLNTKQELVIKTLLYKITSINKSSPIIEFSKEYEKFKKLIIVKDINKKNYTFVKSTYPNTDIFLEEELMINLIDHVLVPKHIKLTIEESSSFYDKYGCKKKDMIRLFSTDPVAKYYDYKVNDIIKVLRPSETSGIGITYRLVVKGEI